MNDELRPLLGGESESYSDRLFSVIMNVVIVVLALVILMHVVVEPVGIIGTSMENSIHDGDTVVLGKLYFSPKRGDVVVIDDGERRIIKRVIAISGDKIGFVREGGDDNYEIALYLDKGYGFVKQNEPYIKEKMTNDSGSVFSAIKVADSFEDMVSGGKYVAVDSGKIVALGDNRNDSSDSRRYGAFAFSDVVGKEIDAFDDKSFWKGFFDFFYRGASPANNKGA